MFFIGKFHTQLVRAGRPVVKAADQGDVAAAIEAARNLAVVARDLESQALRKSQTALIGGNDQLYAEMAEVAAMWGDAGRQIATSADYDEPNNVQLYLSGVNELRQIMMGGPV